ncbi:MAG: DUF1622 domain-containing protein [Actinobacteria bacterium]|nr:DUF1622 domain-containing protein [Actinomycetota bacterium]
MSYEEVLDNVAKIVEATGAAILVLGGATMLAIYLRRLLQRTPAAYTELRRNLGRVILLGLEVLIIGDIIRTIAVDPTLENVAVLGAIVVIRILLSFSLEVEIDGAWPWNRWRTDTTGE